MKGNDKILGVKIDNFSKAETEKWMKDALEGPPQQKFVVTLNPEIALKSKKNEDYRKILNSADLVLCDGFGLKIVSWLKGGNIKTRYTGVDLAEYLLRLSKEKRIKVFIVAAKNSLSLPEEIEGEIEKKYNFSLRARYFEENIFESNEAKNAEIIFVNFGAPDQEKFIFQNRKKFPRAKILVGVGGAFDFLTKKMKRAPEWMQKTGLEWLFRLIQEPKRAKRIWRAVFVFPLRSIIDKE